MLILATTFVQLFKRLILAAIFVKNFKLFSPKALCAEVNVFYCFCRNAKLLVFRLERLPKIFSVARIDATAFFYVVGLIVAILLANTRKPLKFHRFKSVQDLVSFLI